MSGQATPQLEFGELVRRQRGEMVAVVAGMLGSVSGETKIAYLSDVRAAATKAEAVRITYNYASTYCRASLAFSDGGEDYYAGLAAMTNTRGQEVMT